MNASQIARKMATECPAMRARQASRALGRIFDEALRPLGLQLSQLPLLCAAAMAGEAGASIGALARGIVIDPTTLTRGIRPLEKAGLLRVARSPQDKRTRMVFLTRSGERTIERAFPAWQRAIREANEAFGEERIADMRAQLGRIVAAVDGFVGADGPSR
jgi:DNA-binding MarR family transcriptional regulator